MNLHRSFKISKILIAAGAKVSMVSAIFADVSCVDYFLETHDVNSSNSNGETMLIIATKLKRKEIVEHLIKIGANLDATCHLHNTALMYAVMNNDVDIVERLITAGANVNIEDRNNDTALSYAMYDKYTPIIKLLVMANAVIGTGNMVYVIDQSMTKYVAFIKKLKG